MCWIWGGGGCDCVRACVYVYTVVGRGEREEAAEGGVN